MNRLTQKDEQGFWYLKGLLWDDFRVGKEMQMRERLYGALCKLMRYEDTGMEPEDVEELTEIPRPGTEIWCLEYDEEEDEWSYAGYRFMAVCGEYVIACPFYAAHKDFGEQLLEMFDDCVEDVDDIDAKLFRRKDVFLDWREAEKELRRR